MELQRHFKMLLVKHLGGVMVSKKTQFSTFLAGIFILAFFLNFNTQAQTGTSSITGTVVDGQGNVVAGVSITLISEQNSRRSTITNNNGSFSFISITPGTYTLEAESKGFKKTNLSAFQALVDKTTELNIALEVGQVTEIVTIDASSIDNIVNTQDASLGNNFVSRQIEQLPLEGRNVAALLSLQPGVSPDGSVAGSRRDQANITLDGVDVNDQQTGLNLNQDAAFAPVLRVNPDSVEEFRVTTSNPDASKGRSAGAQVSLVTKSGTNSFRGALYEYHRNTVTTANNYFNNISGVERPKLIRNLFGGRLGGPIVKDKFFFFYNYEGMREAKGESVVRLVPLTSLGQGSIKFYDVLLDNKGNPIPGSSNLVTLNAAQINNLTVDGVPVVNTNPAALSVLAAAAQRYPANDTTTGDGINTGGFRFNSPVPVKLNSHTARFDWLVTEDQKHQISFRGNYQHDLIGATSQFPDTAPNNTWSHPIGLAATHTWLINNNLTNRLSYGLTKVAFSDQGDSAENAVTFRNVYSSAKFVRTFNRVNPTHNFTDDLTWLKGNHTFQFGTNIRIIRNKRDSYIAAYDSAVTNPTYYEDSGAVLLTPLNEYLQTLNNTPNTTRVVESGSETSAQNSLTAVLGRLSQYSANFNYGLDGKPIASGAPVTREFATEEYDFYVQDVWKFRPNLTLTLGLRYGVSRPVYETQGYQASPSIPLQEYFQKRIDASYNGQNFTDPLQIVLSGPRNNAPGFYKMDTNNFQPRIAVAWSPRFENGFLASVFGREGESVLRGGFAITNDYFGQQLAVSFDSANNLGFSSSVTTNPNTYNILDCDDTEICFPAPLFTGFGMAIKGLPNTASPGSLTFPQQMPTVSGAGPIERSLDTNLVAPVNYSWNVSWGRQLPGKMYFDLSYVGRAARNLLASRDVMMPNNLRDPKSGQTWYEAATQIELWHREGKDISTIQSLPFFENLWTAGSLDTALRSFEGYTNTQAVYWWTDGIGTDYTFLQHRLDTRTGQRFFQNQYGALSSFGSVGSSDYHAMAFSLRQRLSGVTWDLNYTWSKSMDDASGLQTSSFYGSAFILNPLRQHDSRSVSDFDLTHIINFNSVWDLPVGNGRKFGNNMGGVMNALLGGWQLSTIFRYNTGYPVTYFYEDSGWSTNWNANTGGTQIVRILAKTGKTSGDGSVPNLFENPLEAYNSFRSPLPGETGDRNILRYPSYFTLDAGLNKSFKLPISENSRVSFRWDVFNVTNTARFTGLADYSLGYQPDKNSPPPSWANFTNQQGSPRVMQFALRFDF